MRNMIENVIGKTEGRFLTVRFVKRNGERRTLNGKFVTRKGQYLVMKEAHGGFRNVNIKTITHINSDNIKVLIIK